MKLILVVCLLFGVVLAAKTPETPVITPTSQSDFIDYADLQIHVEAPYASNDIYYSWVGVAGTFVKYLDHEHLFGTCTIGEHSCAKELYAYTVRAGYDPSDLVVKTVQINRNSDMKAPSVTVDGSGLVTITRTSSVVFSDLRYTTNGAPVTSTSAAYTSAFPVGVSIKVRAAEVLTFEMGTRTVGPETVLDVATPPGPPVLSFDGDKVSMQCSASSPGCRIMYGLDGATVATVYSSPVSLPVGTTSVRAVAEKDSLSSNYVVQNYDKLGTLFPPTFVPPPESSHNGTVNVTLLDNNGGANLFFSFDPLKKMSDWKQFRANDTIFLNTTTTIYVLVDRLHFKPLRVVNATYYVTPLNGAEEGFNFLWLALLGVLLIPITIYAIYKCHKAKGAKDDEDVLAYMGKMETLGARYDLTV